ncbi:MAG: hypothetical protein LVQ64_00350 [Thermoplasmatales archaeon]|nr:hypothetical protein [Thermoplasmatales archaeon]
MADQRYEKHIENGGEHDRDRDQQDRRDDRRDRPTISTVGQGLQLELAETNSASPWTPGERTRTAPRGYTPPAEVGMLFDESKFLFDTSEKRWGNAHAHGFSLFLAMFK